MNKQLSFTISFVFAVIIIASSFPHAQAQKHSRARAGRATPAASQPSTPEVAQGAPNGKLITFVDGSTLHVDDAWWRGEEVWFSRKAGVMEMANRKVKSIEPVFIASVETNIKPATAPPIAAATAPDQHHTFTSANLQVDATQNFLLPDFLPKRTHRNHRRRRIRRNQARLCLRFRRWQGFNHRNANSQLSSCNTQLCTVTDDPQGK